MKKKPYLKIATFKIDQLKIKQDLKNKIINDINNDVQNCLNENIVEELGQVDTYLKKVLKKHNVNPQKMEVKIPQNHFSTFLGLLIITFGLSLIIPSNLWTLVFGALFGIIAFVLLIQKSLFTSLISAAISANIFADYFHINLEFDFFALFIILIGLKLIIPTHKYNKFNFKETSFSDENSLVLNRNFGDVKLNLTNEEIADIQVYTNFGDAKINLTDFNFVDNTLIILVNMNFGDLKVIVNENVSVTDYSSHKFGNFRQRNDVMTSTNHVYIFGDITFGDTKILN